LALSAYLDEFSRQPWRSLLLLSCAGVAYLLLTHRHHETFAVAWATMLLAMMPLLLAQPIVHVVRSSRTQRRIRALLAFGFGYGLGWMLAGPLFIAASLLVKAVVGDYSNALLVTLLLALAWSASPWHQAALNRGHRVQNLAVFGLRADLDAFVYGLIHAGWCFASCWAWMLVPWSAGSYHVAIMILIAFIMLIERLASPARPRWRLPLLLRLTANRYAHA
jgi:predicted metal-binding membrane protein